MSEVPQSIQYCDNLSLPHTVGITIIWLKVIFFFMFFWYVFCKTLFTKTICWFITWKQTKKDWKNDSMQSPVKTKWNWVSKSVSIWSIQKFQSHCIMRANHFPICYCLPSLEEPGLFKSSLDDWKLESFTKEVHFINDHKLEIITEFTHQGCWPQRMQVTEQQWWKQLKPRQNQHLGVVYCLNFLPGVHVVSQLLNY